MKYGKISIDIIQASSLTKMVETAIDRAYPMKQSRVYSIIIPEQTKNNRDVSLLAVLNEEYKKLKTLKLKLSGSKEETFPSKKEIKGLLKNFGKEAFYIEYEYRINGNVGRVITHNQSNLSIEQQLALYTDIKERMTFENLYISTSITAKNKTGKLYLESRKKKSKDNKLWSLLLTEKRPNGPFAEYRMSKINKYYKNNIEPYITSKKWKVIMF